MSKLIIHGALASNYVRAAALACEEKGVAYDIDPVGSGGIADLKTPEHKARHPWGRIPAMTHGDVRLFEAAAICRYVDEAFDGPNLQPTDAAGRGRMEQWVSAAICYLAPSMTRDYSALYVFAGDDGPDRAAVEAAVPTLEENTAILEKALSGQDFLVGSDVTIPDLLLVPALFYMNMFPEGQKVLAGRPKTSAYLGRMAARDSFTKTMPQMPGQAAAQ